MKVAMYYSNSDIRIEEMPTPEISENELLLKVKACGICGSDIMEWYRIKTAPRVLGHEATGEIFKLGKNVKNFKIGDRVFVSHHVPCGKCLYCKEGNENVCNTLRTTNFYPGGFSEFVKIPEINVKLGTFILPEKVSFEEGTFIEPLGCVVRAQKIAKIKKGQTILILGSGISGLLHIQLAKSKGCRVIATDVNEFRLNSTKKFGADFAFNAKEINENKIKEINNKKLADRVIVCTGAPSAVKQSFSLTERGGIILFFAPTEPNVEIPVNLWNIWKDGITLTVSYAAAPSDLKEAIELIAREKINVSDMITHRIKLEEIAQGFRLVEKAESSIKVVVEPEA